MKNPETITREKVARQIAAAKMVLNDLRLIPYFAVNGVVDARLFTGPEFLGYIVKAIAGTNIDEDLQTWIKDNLTDPDGDDLDVAEVKAMIKQSIAKATNLPYLPIDRS